MVFIAAGKGSRLTLVTNGIPKPLIILFDKPLIDILVQNCINVGIHDIVIVTGYREDLITNHFGDVTSDLRIEFVYNNDWEFPNGLSVLAAKETIPKGEEFLVSMSDHFYLTDLLNKVKDSSLKATIVNVGIDYNLERIHDMNDAMKVKVKGGDNLINSMSKQLTDYDAVDCGVFKCRYEFFSILELAREKARYSLSEGCELLISKDNLGGVNIGDSFWIDIDTPESLEYCRRNRQMFSLNFTY